MAHKRNARLWLGVASLCLGLTPAFVVAAGETAIRVPGLLAELFVERDWLEALPKLGDREPDGAVRLPAVDIAASLSAFPGTGLEDRFVARIHGTLKVERAGTYRFLLESDDGARLRIGGRKVVEDDGLHSMRVREGEVALDGGDHPIEILYFQNSGGLGLRLSWIPPQREKEVIPQKAFSHLEDGQTRKRLEKGPKLGRSQPTLGGKPRAVSTFHSIGLTLPYREEADAERSATVRYRQKGADVWREGHPPFNDRVAREFRGSLVLLQPGARYEIELRVARGPKESTPPVRLEARTWPETFPVAETIWIEPGTHREPLRLNRSGTARGYLLYSARPGRERETVIDVANQHDNCVSVSASYVIVRGLTLKGARTNAVELKRGSKIHHVVIERCDISGWGRVKKPGKEFGTYADAGIYVRGPVSQVIVQDNDISYPRGSSNSWHPAPGKRVHPYGPQAVNMIQSAGNHVFRYNRCVSDEKHWFQDIIGGGWNFNPAGFPHRDSDIYGNFLSHCRDDAIESEGGNVNVRIWNNRIEKAFVAIAVAPVIKGPCYVWRNVLTDYRSTAFKMGEGDHKGHGAYYLYHNTIYNPEKSTGYAGSGGKGLFKHLTARNNILCIEGRIYYDKRKQPTNTLDYDLLQPLDKHRFMGWGQDWGVSLAEARAVHGFWRHAVTGDPRFANPGAGVLALRGDSPAIDRGVRLAGFNDAFRGKGPDIGAFEFGDATPHYGPRPVPSLARR